MTEANLVPMLLVLAVATVVQYSLIRKRLASLADPLTYFVLTSSFSLALGSFVSDDPWLVFRLYVYFVSFYMGFAAGAGKLQRKFHILRLDPKMQQFRAVVVTCALVYVALNAMMWLQSGVIVLASDPSLEKSEAYAGGLGFVRRFNWSVGAFALIASLYWFLWERRVSSALTITAVVLTTLTGGSKSALLPAVFAAGLYIARPFASHDKTDHSIRLRRAIPLLVGFAFVPVMFVLTAENGTLKGALDALVVRLFYFGDVMLYWGQETVRSRFSDLGPLDYLKNTLGSVLGALRLIPYDTPIGNQFVQQTLPAGFEFSEFLGPNLPFYVRGELYFGILLAPVHSFFVGFVFGRLRRCFMRYRGRSLLAYSMLAFLVVISLALPAEEGLAVGQLFDYALFFLPIYAMATYLSVPLRHAQPRAGTAGLP